MHKSDVLLIMRTPTKFVDESLKTLTTAEFFCAFPTRLGLSLLRTIRLSRTSRRLVPSNLHSNFNQRYTANCNIYPATRAHVCFSHRLRIQTCRLVRIVQSRRRVRYVLLSRSSSLCNYFPLAARHVNSNCSRIT